MRRTVPFLALSILIAAMLIAGAGSSPAAQAAQTTAVPTKAAPTVTAPAGIAGATKAATKAPARATAVATDSAATEPLTFAKAPSPEAGSLGVTLSDTDPVSIRGTYPAGPAEKAGIQAGDEILKLDGVAIKDREDLFTRITTAKPGTIIKFTINRDGQEMEISVPVQTRRAVYCPVPEDTKLTAGVPIVKDILGDEKNWTLTGDSTKGVEKIVKGGKLTFTATKPEVEWIALANLRAKPFVAYALELEFTQTGAAAAGIFLNSIPPNSAYQLQFLPNGSWQMSALIEGATSAGALSFSETILNAQDEKTPGGAITNTLRVVTDGNDMFLYFNGKFACGIPLYLFADPPLDAGTIGLYAIVGADKTGAAGVSFNKLTIDELK